MSSALPPYTMQATDEPAPQERDMLAAPLLAYNEALLGPSNIHLVAVLIRSQDDGRVLGGLWGANLVPMVVRGIAVHTRSPPQQGLGTQLLARAEEEAKARGCHGAWLDTFSQEACRFYERRGYQVFGAIPDYPPGNTRSFLSKQLNR